MRENCYLLSKLSISGGSFSLVENKYSGLKVLDFCSEEATVYISMDR